MGRPRTLFTRTALTLTAGFIAFLLFAVPAALHFILIPLGKLAADDLAALIIHSANDWNARPAGDRLVLEAELMRHFDLKIARPPAATLPAAKAPLPYLHFLEQALRNRSGRDIEVKTLPNETKWYAVNLVVQGEPLQVSFPRSRIGPQPPLAVLLMVAAGALVVLVTTLLLVRRLTEPLTRLSDATSRVGHGEALPPLPESGPLEIATLTRNFNRMAAEISGLLANRTTLFAGISHDLRSPITRMRLALEMLPEQADPDLVDRLRRDLDAMNRLISETLELARGLGPRAPQTIDVNDLVDAVVEEFRQEGADITWVRAPPCIRDVDTLALRRVLSNLVDNAARYGGGESVEVRCLPQPAMVIIEIRDHGPGIPEQEQQAVFRPFYRLEGSRSRSTGGTGLGLAIADQLCRVHGWAIRLLPNRGGGTVAELRLPR